jgi:hypothetical protein
VQPEPVKKPVKRIRRIVRKSPAPVVAVAAKDSVEVIKGVHKSNVDF